MRRAGLDYHEYATMKVHDDWAICAAHFKGKRIFAVSTMGSQRYDTNRYLVDDVFLFGPETRGLPADLLMQFPAERRIRLPMLRKVVVSISPMPQQWSFTRPGGRLIMRTSPLDASRDQSAMPARAKWGVSDQRDGSVNESTGVRHLVLSSGHHRIGRKPGYEGPPWLGIRKQLKMHVHEVKAQSLLPFLTAGAGIGSRFFGCIGSSQ